MLRIEVNRIELFDEEASKLIDYPHTILTLAHSLLTISKWESITNKPFMVPKALERKYPKTPQDLILYMDCMVVGNSPKYSGTVLWHLHRQTVFDYMASPQSATVIRDHAPSNRSGKFITSEEIYLWMINYGIPFEAERWHINRLLTLIKMRSIQENPKKRSQDEVVKELTALTKKK